MTSPVYTDLVTGEILDGPRTGAQQAPQRDRPRHTAYELERLRGRQTRDYRTLGTVATHVALAGLLVAALATR